jgi:hypothetical protein
LTGSRRSVALLTSTLAAVLLAGCAGGGSPHLARQDAAPLITLADKISREAPCAQARDIRALRARTIALVNAHRIPAALQESLTSGVNALVEPPCLPVVPTDTTPTFTIPGWNGWNGWGGDNGGGGGD